MISKVWWCFYIVGMCNIRVNHITLSPTTNDFNYSQVAQIFGGGTQLLWKQVYMAIRTTWFPKITLRLDMVLLTWCSLHGLLGFRPVSHALCRPHLHPKLVSDSMF